MTSSCDKCGSCYTFNWNNCPLCDAVMTLSGPDVDTVPTTDAANLKPDVCAYAVPKIIASNLCKINANYMQAMIDQKRDAEIRTLATYKRKLTSLPYCGVSRQYVSLVLEWSRDVSDPYSSIGNAALSCPFCSDLLDKWVSG